MVPSGTDERVLTDDQEKMKWVCGVRLQHTSLSRCAMIVAGASAGPDGNQA